MTVGERIKERRKALGMSADKLGELLGKDRSTIYRYEKGDIENLPLDILEPIAAVLQTSPQYLMGWEQVQKNNDAITDIIIRMRTDNDFLSVVKSLYQLDAIQLAGVQQMLNAFLK